MAAGKGGNQRQQRRRQQRRQDNRLADRATNDVQLQMQPQFDYNNAQLQQAQENYLRAMQTAQSASGGAYDAIGQAERPHFQQIAEQFTGNLNALAPEFGGAGAAMPYTQNSIYGERGGTIGMPAGEVAAGNALGGAIGSAGLSGLANDAARWGMSRENAQQEASVFGRNQQAALLQNMQDVLQQHENENQNLMAQQPYQIKSRIDELRDQAIEEQLARSKMRSDRAFSDMLAQKIGGLTSGGGRPGGGSTRPAGGGGGGGGNGGTVDVGYGGYGGGVVTHPNQGQGEPGYQTGWRPATVNAVQEADYVNELPGWVRYAFNHGGARALQDPRREDLYRNKLRELLQRFKVPGVDIPGGPLGF